MAKKKARKATRAARPAASRTVRSVSARTNMSMEKGDVSLPSPKIDKKKWLYIGVGIVVILAIIYYVALR